MSEMGNKEKKAKVDDDGDISVGDNSVHFDGEKSWYNKHGYNDATGKLWWDQHDELAEMERHEELLDIEKLKPTTDPVLWRIRKLRPYQKVPGSSIVNDTESRWVQCIRQDEEWLNGAVTIFSDLPRNLVEKIFIMAIERPSAHNSIACSCKEFTLICEDRLVLHDRQSRMRQRMQRRHASMRMPRKPKSSDSTQVSGEVSAQRQSSPRDLGCTPTRPKEAGLQANGSKG
jgi:hypothetical protein